MFRRLAPVLFTLSSTLLLPMSTVYAQGKNKDHHDGNGFKNPWDSFISLGFGSVLKMMTSIDMKAPLKNAKPGDKPLKVDIDWNLLRKTEQTEQNDNDTGTITATWLGHACIFLQIKGFNVLFDPIFSDRCSPLSFAGPKRYTDPPCTLKELPKIDAVIISHNHYDHLDVETIKELSILHPECKFYVPLGNKSWFKLAKNKDSQGNDRVIELDWWESANLQRYVEGTDKQSKNIAAELRFTCTPCQHFSGRGLFDRNKTLWASWCVEGLSVNGGNAGGKVFFGGDTGYRSVPANTEPEAQYDIEYLQKLPHCPVFKEIGDTVGPFDLALIPIGAYSPRWFMSPIHCSPEDAVELHKDIKSKHSIGIHWGTFILTDEPLYEPPKRLEAAMTQHGLDPNDFGVLQLGGTFTVKATTTTDAPAN